MHQSPPISSKASRITRANGIKVGRRAYVQEVSKHASALNILNVNIHTGLRVLFTPKNQNNTSLNKIHHLLNNLKLLKNVCRVE